MNISISELISDKTINLYGAIAFFLSIWFSFKDTGDSRDRWGMESPIFISLYHLRVLTDIQTFRYLFAYLHLR